MKNNENKEKRTVTLTEKILAGVLAAILLAGSIFSLVAILMN